MISVDIHCTRTDAAVVTVTHADATLLVALTGDLHPTPRDLLSNLLHAAIHESEWWTESGLLLLVETLDARFTAVSVPRKLIGGSVAAVAVERATARVRVLGDIRVLLVREDDIEAATRLHILAEEADPIFLPPGVDVANHPTMLSRWLGGGHRSEGYSWQVGREHELVVACYEARYGADNSLLAVLRLGSRDLDRQLSLSQRASDVERLTRETS